MEAGGVEWGSERAQLIEQDTERPNIRFKAIGSSLNDFRWQIVRCANHSLSLWPCIAQHPGYPKVSQFAYPSFSQKHIWHLEITMYYLPVMTVFQSKAYLCQPIQYGLLCETNRCLMFNRWRATIDLFFYLQAEVTCICILHYNAETMIFGLINFFKAYDVRMTTKNLKDLAFFQCFLLFLVSKILNIKLFNHS